MELSVRNGKLNDSRSDKKDLYDLINGLRGLVNGRGAYFRTVTTTNATATAIWTDVMAANSVALVWSEFVGETATGASVGGYVRSATFQRVGTAAVTYLGGGSDIIGTDKESDPTWDAGHAIDAANPGNIYAYVQGAAATTINWRARVTALVLPWL